MHLGLPESVRRWIWSYKLIFLIGDDFGMLSAIMNAEDAVKEVSQKKLTITEISWYFFSFLVKEQKHSQAEVNMD